MLVDVKLRDRLDDYCRVKKLTQAQGANELIEKALADLENDGEMKERMDKAKMLKEELARL
jgi:hypothetical protein